MSIDILFITPNSSKKVYQDLSKDYTAIEPPTWSLLLAQSCRSKGFKVDILDANAERLSDEVSFKKVKEINPRIICFVVYGQNVNAGTTNMVGAVDLANFIKDKEFNSPIVFIGSHIQALPYNTLNDEKSIDIICTNEGVYSLHNLLKLSEFKTENLSKIKGIGFRDKGVAKLTPPELVVPQDKMDVDLPGYAWDLLPYKDKPFDLYRAPMWHAEYLEENRSPYAAIQTSLGCQFGCSFCMINIINRNDNDEIGVSSNYSKMRFWSTDFIIKEFIKLFKYGVKTIRIVDEMFLLNPKYYIPLCEKLKELNKNDSFKMWAYSRIDTIRRKNILSLVRSAGIKWLCLGIESGNKEIRLEVAKGKFEDVDVEQIVKQVHDSDIEIMANYIYGLPGDSVDTIDKTYELSEKLNTLGWNTYAAMPLPGSALYKDALNKNYKMPEKYEDFSFHSYNTQPLPTKYLKPAEILKLRDENFIKYHTNENFLKKIEKKFGSKAKNNILEMSKIKLKRK
ncbi:radical SAM protein, partial [Candidatus Pelagibacter sp.]|nr:radical SAM protein [Candidatus Pelagibacter sp.]